MARCVILFALDRTRAMKVLLNFDRCWRVQRTRVRRPVASSNQYRLQSLGRTRRCPGVTYRCSAVRQPVTAPPAARTCDQRQLWSDARYDRSWPGLAEGSRRATVRSVSRRRHWPTRSRLGGNRSERPAIPRRVWADVKADAPYQPRRERFLTVRKAPEVVRGGVCGNYPHVTAGPGKRAQLEGRPPSAVVFEIRPVIDYEPDGHASRPGAQQCPGHRRVRVGVREHGDLRSRRLDDADDKFFGTLVR